MKCVATVQELVNRGCWEAVCEMWGWSPTVTDHTFGSNSKKPSWKSSSESIAASACSRER